MKFSMVWHKISYFSYIKDAFALRTSIYAIQITKVIPSYIFEPPFYKKQIFKNLNTYVRICGITHKIQTNTSIIHRYFIH